jgi:hypothetical protein
LYSRIFIAISLRQSDGFFSFDHYRHGDITIYHKMTGFKTPRRHTATPNSAIDIGSGTTAMEPEVMIKPVQ